LNITCFGVISRKETLDDYKNQIDNKKFYNKCATYLLECIGQYAREKNIDKKEIKLYFEKGNFAYEKLRNFISKCQKTPFQSRANNLKFIEPYNIYHKTKEEMPSLEIADLIAHSLYKIVDKNRANFGITEPRYFNILRPLFYSDPKNNILNYGLKPIHNINDLGLSKDEIEALNL